MRSFFPLLLALATTASAQNAAQPSLIPKPVSLELRPGQCNLECPWSVEGDPTVSRALLDQLGAEVSAMHPPSTLQCFAPLSITLRLFLPDTVLPSEYYALAVRENGISITATTEEGLFRGSRTLVQLLEQMGPSASLPCMAIVDYPRFGWRGMHLDVSRHFFEVDFVKKYIDLLARYKMNRFHWHLTDDQGWRIEIKKYPKLTEVGAWRSGSQVGPYSRREYDSIPYGGFYTQEQIREVVSYAAARHITVVPEIEMPGHAMAALAAYPYMGCTGGPYEVQRGWGVFDDVFCAGSDRVFAVLEDVLTEVMELFPGEYIHIGGDECPKERWKTCRECQSRMKEESLKDEHELQSYFIQRIERFVNSRGRKIIGWDEILEGGLAPNAAVMSWRGTEGGVAAAQSGHYAVMSPGSHCYFDHYQGDPANEPLAIGGYTTVQKVYSYEPIPTELNAVEAMYILGAQGNVWTEYILTPEHVEYMAAPRMLALAEVLWTPKEKRDEADFMRRLETEFPRLEAMKVNASKSLYQVSLHIESGVDAGTIKWSLRGGKAGKPILFRTKGTVPVQYGDETSLQDIEVHGAYSKPMIMDSDQLIEAQPSDSADVEAGDYPRIARKFHFNKATAQKITLDVPPSERYNEGGAFTLVDGITAQEKRVSTEWLGWLKSATVTVDLGSVQDIGHISIGALNETYSWIHAPAQVDFSISSDGKTFAPFGSAKPKVVVGRNEFALEKPTKARYVRFAVKHAGLIPEGFPGAGKNSWLFLDEIDIH